MILLISYDLNGHERPEAYEAVKAAVENNSNEHRKILYSQWLVATDLSPDAWSDLISEAADSSDSWFICQVQRPYQGWLDKELWEWLNARV
jgi:hypothetical protein